MPDYTGKRVLIVGCGPESMGAATALRCAWAGAATIVVADLNDPRQLARELIGLGVGAVSSYQVDAAYEPGVQKLFGNIQAKHGTLDVMIVTVGATSVEQVMGDQGLNTSMAAYTSIMQANTLAPFLLAKHGHKLLGRGGVMLFVSSIVAAHPSVGQLVYGAGKAALEAMVMNLAVELSHQGIRVVAVTAGMVATGAMKQLLPPAIEAVMTAHELPAGRPVATADEMAAVLAFVASDAGGLFAGVVPAARGLGVGMGGYEEVRSALAAMTQQ